MRGNGGGSKGRMGHPRAVVWLLAAVLVHMTATCSCDGIAAGSNRVSSSEWHPGEHSDGVYPTRELRDATEQEGATAPPSSGATDAAAWSPAPAVSRALALDDDSTLPFCSDFCQSADNKIIRDLRYCGPLIDYVTCAQATSSAGVTAPEAAEAAAKAMVEEYVGQLDDDEDCQAAYKAFVCYIHFPQCTGDNRIMPVCRSTCENLLRACDSDPITVCDGFEGVGPSGDCTGAAVRSHGLHSALLVLATLAACCLTLAVGIGVHVL